MEEELFSFRRCSAHPRGASVSVPIAKESGSSEKGNWQTGASGRSGARCRRREKAVAAISSSPGSRSLPRWEAPGAMSEKEQQCLK